MYSSGANQGFSEGGSELELDIGAGYCTSEAGARGAQPPKSYGAFNLV